MARRDRAGLAPFTDCLGPDSGQACRSLSPAQAFDDGIHAECHTRYIMGRHFPAQRSGASSGKFPPDQHNCVTSHIVGGIFSRGAGMSLRDQFSDQVKASMKAGNAPRTSTLRMILARLKDIDIAARPKGIERVPEEEIVGMLRGMVKSRRESVELYRQGHRQDLVDKEEAEIAVIEGFLPQQMDEGAMTEAVAAAIAETGAASIKDMGKVMAALRAKHAATLDMAKAGPMVKTELS